VDEACADGELDHVSNHIHIISPVPPKVVRTGPQPVTTPACAVVIAEEVFCKTPTISAREQQGK
jgi:hypothetical protein